MEEWGPFFFLCIRRNSLPWMAFSRASAGADEKASIKYPLWNRTLEYKIISHSWLKLIASITFGFILFC